MYDVKFVYGNLDCVFMTEEKKKVVAFLSGGLDSQLAVRMMQEQGF